MKYPSKKFRSSDKDDILLYFMSIIALVQIFYLVMNKKYMMILAFIALGILLNVFIRNQIFVLILDVIIINILLNLEKKEGLTNSDTTDTTSTDATTDAMPLSTDSNTKNKLNKKATPSVSKTATSVNAPTTLKPTDSGSIGNVGQHIESLSNLMDRFTHLTKNLGLGKK
uniref:Uncharacterized protein n=1 Tax=viral metagenome TaxID=1070528 RepID=A0A6C0HSW8_9ZZZZ